MKIADLLGSILQSPQFSDLRMNTQPTMPVSDSLAGNTIIIPVDASNSTEKDVINPGIEYGENGRAKWSPPLQQQLSVIKGAVGTTTDDPTVEPTNSEKDELVAARNNTGSNSNSAVELVKSTIDSDEPNAEENDMIARLKELAAIIVASQNAEKTSQGSVAQMLTRNFP